MADEPDMVERVAGAIRDNIAAALPDGVTLDYDYAARASIEAMREPTMEMWEAGDEADGYDVHGPVWRAMIDAALQKRGRG